MDETELRKIIREEIKTQLIREASNDAKQAVRDVTKLDADDLEYFLKALGVYFLQNKNDFDNMDARGISTDILSAYKKIKNRTGN